MNSHELKLFKLHQCDSKLNEQIHFRKKKKIYKHKTHYIRTYVYISKQFSFNDYHLFRISNILNNKTHQ
jgi:hypothetical protein